MTKTTKTTKTPTRIAAASAGLLLAAGLTLVDAPSASALTSGLQHSVATDKCLGIYGNVDTYGQDAVVWGCNGNADQRWEFTSVGGGYYQLKNANNRCLGVYAPSGDAIQWGCNGNADQKWHIDSTGRSAQLRNGADYNSCLTVDGSGDGARAVMSSCAYRTDQLWY